MKNVYSRMSEKPEEDEDVMNEEIEGGSLIEIPTEEIPDSEKWKDGETYDISMTVKQISKGKFEILEAEEETPEEEKSAEDKEE